MFNFALVQHIEQRRNNPREGYLPSTWRVIARLYFCFCWTLKQEHVGGFSLSSEAPEKRSPYFFSLYTVLPKTISTVIITAAMA